MDILTNLSGQIVQATERKSTGLKVNGMFVPAIPATAPVVVDSASYVLPVDGGDVSSLAFSNLLTQFPMYAHIVFNSLLTASDVAALELANPLPAPVTPPVGTATKIRAMVGRGAGPLAVGQSPNRTTVLAKNPVTNVAGMIMTETIDISALVPAGVDEVSLWWQLEQVTRTHDVTSTYGATTGLNTPCDVFLHSQSPEPAGFDVYISNDDGATWYPAGFLSPVDMLNVGPLLRVAFVNTSNTAYRLSGFAIMF